MTQPYLFFSLFSFLIMAILTAQYRNLLASSSFTGNRTDYDAVAFSCKTWKRIDISWSAPSHTGYLNHASLLRPDNFVQRNNLVTGHHARLNMPEFGAPDTPVNIMAIRSLSQDGECLKWVASGSSSPVIGVYRYQTDKVQKFIFKNNNSHITSINTTPGHPFYVYSINRYLPINKIIPSMKLLDKNGRFVSLAFSKVRENHYGKGGNHKKIFTVYNLEVYRQHHYFAGKSNLLVHNTCVLAKKDPETDPPPTLQDRCFNLLIRDFLIEKIAKVGRAFDKANDEGIYFDTGNSLLNAVQSHNKAVGNLFDFLDYAPEQKAEFISIFGLELYRFQTTYHLVSDIFARREIGMSQIESAPWLLKPGESIKLIHPGAHSPLRLTLSTKGSSLFSGTFDRRLICEPIFIWYDTTATAGIKKSLGQILDQYTLKTKPFLMKDLKHLMSS